MTSVFPPYGRFARVYANSVEPSALAPKAWQPSLPLAEWEANWATWFDRTLSLINHLLWPQWDTTTRAWINGDEAKMMQLTEADFRLFKKLFATAPLTTRPQTPTAAASIPKHGAYFVDEDTSKLADRYFYYDTTLSSEIIDAIPSLIRDSIRELSGSASIQFKERLQRPRAYQMAQILGKEHPFELGLTSMTSSMSSGHCFQGHMAAVGIYQNWLQKGFTITENQIVALAQFGADIGDRRVFAGVHYPSDNISSWLISMLLVAEICPDKRVAQFLARSIKDRSQVYQLLSSSKETAYASALDELDKLITAALDKSDVIAGESP